MIARRTLLGAAGAAFPLARARAQAWRPAHTVTLLVPFAGGSGTDAVARILADLLAKPLGVPVVVDNRAGANGSIAAQAGYTGVAHLNRAFVAATGRPAEDFRRAQPGRA